MANEQQKSSLMCGLESWVFALLCLLVGVSPSTSTKAMRELYLNSYVHCGHGDAKELGFTVDRNTIYNVLDDVSAEIGSHTFRECELVFRSTRSDSRLCVLQRKLDFHHKCHVKLELYDGWVDVDGVTKPNKTLNCDHSLLSVEWCTSGRYLSVKMSPNGKSPSIRDVSIDVLVYDIQSVHRTASLDYVPSCLSTFLMDGSSVVVTNIDPSGHVRKQLFPECALTFEYKGRDKNRTMCMIFEAVQELNRGCSKLNYTLKVFSFIGNRLTGPEYKELSTTRSCDKPSPRKWCSNSTKISLELHRKITPGAENAVVFRATVLDHKGGVNSLPDALPLKEESSPNMGVWAAIGLGAGVVLSLLVICAVVLCLTRRPCRSKEHSDKSVVEKDGEAGATMLEPNGNGHCGGDNPEQNYLSDEQNTSPTFV